jgi:hypothetical protein
VLDIHELAAGKLTALFSRTAARDLYDTYQLFHKANLGFDYTKLRLAFIIYGAMSRINWLTISMNDLNFDYEELKNRLIPVLNIEEVKSIQDLKQWSNNLQESCKQSLDFLFPFNAEEKQFLDLINNHGEIRPELLTNDQHLRTILQCHPALQWKALKVKEFNNKK